MPSPPKLDPFRSPLADLKERDYDLQEGDEPADPLAGTEDRARLFSKLLLAQDDAPYLESDGVFAGGPLMGKPYVSAAGAVKQLAPTLRKFGLVLTMSEIETVSERFDGKPKQDRSGTVIPGAPWWMYTGTYEFQLTDVQTGYTATFRQNGRSANDDDRGPQHAHAQATKVFLMSLLQVQMDVGEGQRRTARKPGEWSNRAQEARGGPPPSQGQPPRSEARQPSGSAPAGNRTSSRIPEAANIRFVKNGNDWLKEGNGEVLRGCDCGGPMLELKPGEFHCVDASHGLIWRRPAEAEEQQPDPLMADLQANARATRTLQEAKDAYGRIILKNRLYPWQIRAIIEANNYVMDQSKWGAAIYLEIHDALQQNAPKVVATALAEMAKKTPADPEAIGHLQNLVTRAKIVGVESIEVGEAIKSGWHDAVMELVERYETKVGQGELAVGGRPRNQPRERRDLA